MSDIADRLTEYVVHGGLYSSELMQHEKLRELLIDCRDEIVRLREAIRRLADQDATLSVCNGNVTVDIDDGSLTEAERQAVEYMTAGESPFKEEEKHMTVLRGLLDRTRGHK